MKEPTGKLVNYGFNPDLVEIEKEAYILGVNSKLPTTVYKPDGQWPDVTYEPQAERYETYGCIVWGGQNQIEIFTKGVYNTEPNYDERFSYLYSGISIENGGANPQNFYQSARHNGLIDNEPLPSTLLEFQDKSYLTSERIDRGEDWTVQWEFMHDWLTDTSKKTIQGALPLSPIAVSVTAWFRDADGLYVDKGTRNSHWVVVKGYVRKGDDLSKFECNEAAVKNMVAQGKIILKAFDSYNHSHKLLHPDHKISFAKRIHLRERSVEEINALMDTDPVWQKLLQSLWEALKKLSEILPKVPEPKWPEPKKKPEPPPNNILNAFCLAIQKHEGWFPGSRSQRNNNPGNCRYSPVGYLPIYEPVKKDPQNFAIFKDYKTGFLYLKNLVKSKAKKHPEWDLYDFFGEYAPIQDNNNPILYAEKVAKEAKLDIKTFRMKHLT